MAVTTLTSIPEVIEAGNTVRFTAAYADYPVGTWTAALYIGFDTPVLIAATTSGSNFLFTLPLTTTAAWPSGQFPYSIYATSGGERTTAQTGTVRIDPNRAQTRTPSAAEIQLEKIRDTIAILAADPDAQVSFNGQSRGASSIGEFKRMEVQLAAQVLRETRARLALAGGTQPTGEIAVRYA